MNRQPLFSRVFVMWGLVASVLVGFGPAAASAQNPASCPSCPLAEAQSQPAKAQGSCVTHLGPMMEPNSHGEKTMTIECGTDDDVSTTQPGHAGWLGVVVSEVPPALRAHLKLPQNQGLMIRNVVQGSPAENRLQRYDLVLTADEQPVGDIVPKFVDAVGRKEPGESLKLQVIRAGAKMNVEIKLTSRPAHPEQMEMLYEDDEIMAGTEQQPGAGGLRGQWLRRAPGGGWVVGDLPDQLPPEIQKKLEELLLQIPTPPGGGAVRPLPGLNMQLQIGGTKNRINFIVARDGKTFTFQQDGDKINVILTGPNGVEKKTYNSAETLQKADPEIYKVYEETIGKMRVQVNVPHASIQVGTGEKDKVEAVPGGTSFSVSNTGEITVEMNTTGTTIKKTFANEAELQKQAPNLYEEYKKVAEKMK